MLYRRVFLIGEGKHRPAFFSGDDLCWQAIDDVQSVVERAGDKSPRVWTVGNRTEWALWSSRQTADCRSAQNFVPSISDLILDLHHITKDFFHHLEQPCP